jgi:hypothetical protein
MELNNSALQHRHRVPSANPLFDHDITQYKANSELSPKSTSLTQGIARDKQSN